VAPVPALEFFHGDKFRVDLYALKPGLEGWSELAEWLTETERYEPLVSAGQAYLEVERSDDVARCVHRGSEELIRVPPDELHRRTMLPEDGQREPLR
jgi:hypothetical protein